MSALLPAIGPDRPVPAFALRVGGLPLPPQAAADVISVTAHQDVDLPAMFTVRLLNWDAELRRMRWSDAPPFEPGAAVEVDLGYVGALQTVLTGEITGLELEIDGSRPPVLVVRGYDRRHRLMRGQLTRSYVGVTDTDIARRIGTERGLAVEATPTPQVLAHVLQHNQTDLEFLTDRAARLGYEVALEDRTLLFRPRRRPRVATVRLQRDGELIAFSPRLTTMGQTSGAVVQSWDPARPKAQLRAVVGTDDPKADGDPLTATLPTAGALAVGNRTVIRPLADQAEAKALADGLSGSTEPWRIVASGICLGRPDLRAGDLVHIDGLGSRFSGDYAVSAARHTFDPTTGYRTSFDARREPS